MTMIDKINKIAEHAIAAVMVINNVLIYTIADY